MIDDIDFATLNQHNFACKIGKYSGIIVLFSGTFFKENYCH